MKIAIDTQAFFSPIFKGRGIANYVHNQLLKLLETDTENEYILLNLYSQDSVIESFFSGKQYPQLSECRLYTGADQFLVRRRLPDGKLYYSDLMERIVRRFLDRYEIDVFYLTSPFDHWAFMEPEWLEGVQTIATVYDVIPYIMKETYLPAPEDVKEYMRRIELLKSFDKVLAISQSVKDDLVNYFGFEPFRIDVIYCGISPVYTKAVLAKERIRELDSRYSIDKPFIFCAGGADYRKNMPEMVQAYARLPQQLREQYQLVLACKWPFWYPDTLDEAAAKLGLNPQDVVCTGYLPDQDLVDMYRYAVVTFFASQYEGFGMPAIESMACGTPVVTSNNSSLGEIAKGAAILVDPFDTQSMADGLAKALTGGAGTFELEMEEKAKAFTWKKVADSTFVNLSIFKAVDRPKEKNIGKLNRLAMFTPLPPLASGISEYSAELIGELAKQVEIDVFVDDTLSPEDVKINGCRVLKHTEFPARKAFYDAVLYQVGNSGYHSYMLPYIKQFGGVVELHDANLHLWLYDEAVMVRGDYEEYGRILAEDYPAWGAAYARDVLVGNKTADVDTIYVNGIATKYADGLIVHSAFTQRKLLELDINRGSSIVPLFAQKASPKTKLEARQEWGIKEDAFVMASFGSVAQNRRLEVAIKAFTALLREYPDALLYITGGDDKGTLAYLKGQAEQLGVAGSVVFTGRLQDAQLKNMVKACDVCVNLRWPYRGENSAIATLALASGTPLIVTNTGSFAEIPDTSCIKIQAPETPLDSYFESENLLKGLLQLAGDKCFAQNIARAALEYAEGPLALSFIAEEIINILSDPVKKCWLNEKVLDSVSETLCIPGRGTTQQEIENLATTLQFIK